MINLIPNRTSKATTGLHQLFKQVAKAMFNGILVSKNQRKKTMCSSLVFCFWGKELL